MLFACQSIFLLSILDDESVRYEVCRTPLLAAAVAERLALSKFLGRPKRSVTDEELCNHWRVVCAHKDVTWPAAHTSIYGGFNNHV